MSFLNKYGFQVFQRKFLSYLSLCVLVLFSSCSRPLLFKATFDTVGQGYPPSIVEIGHVRIEGWAFDIHGEKITGIPRQWVNLTRRTSNTVALQGTINYPENNAGKYIFTSYLYIPSGGGVASIQFEAWDQAIYTRDNFLHLDFLPNGNVMIDGDSSSKFGHFPHDSVFVVQATIDLTTAPNVNIVLTGGGANGHSNKIIQALYQSNAYKFGSFRLISETPIKGSFYATNILIEKLK
ncbi:MAG TPA: hypothetical protein VK590_09375 [Saprospiraceae bacterium]|nr:hypothetical protein [Saprospiraceae bacterium]